MSVYCGRLRIRKPRVVRISLAIDDPYAPFAGSLIKTYKKRLVQIPTYSTHWRGRKKGFCLFPRAPAEADPHDFVIQLHKNTKNPSQQPNAYSDKSAKKNSLAGN